MKFNRHSRRRMKLYGITEAEVAAVVSSPDAEQDADEQGNPRYTARVGGRVVRVVISADDPEMVKSVFPRRG
ncbi:DUF4258 domain-containing protein [Miltoncostaea marina]|uniref:DUF4258 domain-containing protein n=1 Tax=Miltoncostaea marina TaxID=2843215 RepID=UPI001C3C8AD9|nr:DUF4258 domain-containing protein [Miltoncostaea marina]